jgi:hypothetical protein
MDPIGARAMRVFSAFLVCVLLFPLHAYALGAGDAAPDFSVVTLGGKEISYYEEIRGEKPLYFVFWATW